MIFAIFNMVGYNWPTCIVCLVVGASLIAGYWIYERRKGKK